MCISQLVVKYLQAAPWRSVSKQIRWRAIWCRILSISSPVMEEVNESVVFHWYVLTLMPDVISGMTISSDVWRIKVLEMLLYPIFIRHLHVMIGRAQENQTKVFCISVVITIVFVYWSPPIPTTPRCLIVSIVQLYLHTCIRFHNEISVDRSGINTLPDLTIIFYCGNICTGKIEDTLR